MVGPPSVFYMFVGWILVTILVALLQRVASCSLVYEASSPDILIIVDKIFDWNTTGSWVQSDW